MEPTLYKTIELENGQTLRILDLSRTISEDAFVVKMKAAIDIKIKPELFSNALPSGVSLEELTALVGDTVVYEYEMERNFILKPLKDEVFDGLVKTFLNNLGQYVAKPNFPEKVIVKAYKDSIKQSKRLASYTI
ncbi:MAG: hypothetical protein ABIJ31_13995 [Pseudomonadota bacterium]